MMTQEGQKRRTFIKNMVAGTMGLTIGFETPPEATDRKIPVSGTTAQESGSVSQDVRTQYYYSMRGGHTDPAIEISCSVPEEFRIDGIQQPIKLSPNTFFWRVSI